MEGGRRKAGRVRGQKYGQRVERRSEWSDGSIGLSGTADYGSFHSWIDGAIPSSSGAGVHTPARVVPSGVKTRGPM